MSTARGLYLPPAVLSLANLSWPARLVLAEILDLHKVNGQVWANDQHFVKRLPGTSMRAVQRAIQELDTAGHITRITNQAAYHKRILTPTISDTASLEPVANLAIAPNLPPDWREPIANLAVELSPNLREPIANLADINYTLNIKENNNSAAVAAGVESSFSGSASAEQPASPPAASSKKHTKHGASLAEIASLTLPHAAPEFAEAWRTFTMTNTKQAGKPLTAFELMLKKLGKYPAAFAVVMLEAAIQGNWSGVENAGTARAFTEWQNEQTRQATLRPMPMPSAGPAPRTTPDYNPEVVAERQRQREAEAAASRQRIRAAAQAI